jgi:hypothetical protein
MIEKRKTYMGDLEDTQKYSVLFEIFEIFLASTILKVSSIGMP